MRNAYLWMAQTRLRGYRKSDTRAYDTEFDRWMREMNLNTREAALLLDLPHQRICDLRAGWRTGRLNGGIVPNFITCYAMSALKAGLQAGPETAESYDIVVRLGQAAFEAGLAPWPPGELLLVNPNTRRPGKLRQHPMKGKRVVKNPQPKLNRGGRRDLKPADEA